MLSNLMVNDKHGKFSKLYFTFNKKCFLVVFFLSPEFDEQVNMVYVSADTLGIARNSVIIGLRQSRADYSLCRPSPDESSEVTQRRSTPEGETQTAKEHDRKRESTTSENFYAVVEDNDLEETNP